MADIPTREKYVEKACSNGSEFLKYYEVLGDAQVMACKGEMPGLYDNAINSMGAAATPERIDRYVRVKLNPSSASAEPPAAPAPAPVAPPPPPPGEPAKEPEVTTTDDNNSPWVQFDLSGFVNLGAGIFPSYGISGSGSGSGSSINDGYGSAGEANLTKYPGGGLAKIRIFPFKEAWREKLGNASFGLLIKPMDLNYGVNGRSNGNNSEVGSLGMFGVGLSYLQNISKSLKFVLDVNFNLGYSFGGAHDGKVEQGGDKGFAKVNYAYGFGAMAYIQWYPVDWFGLHAGLGLDTLFAKYHTNGTRDTTEDVMGLFFRLIGGVSLKY